jgi:hypothetical protein
MNRSCNCPRCQARREHHCDRREQSGLACCRHGHDDRCCCECCDTTHQQACVAECPPPSEKPKPGSQRPGRPAGTDSGRLKDPTPLTKGDLEKPLPPGVWVGPRKDMFLPYLFMRANPGDLGARPVVGPFWESPDIFILAGVTPALAPPKPPALGQTAIANKPNTIYAHVWNFGNATASEVIVEFYWCDPSLGINPASVHLIAQTEISLGAKGSGWSHALVKCPEAWTPTFLNGGHECLLVRVWDNPSDLPGEPKFDASINRHVAQRNIHVVSTAPGQGLGAAGPLSAGTPVAMPNPLFLKVGPLYGAPASVTVERVTPHTMPWLQLRTGVRGKFPAHAMPTGAAMLSRPVANGGGYPVNGSAAQQHVTGDDQQIAFTTSDALPQAGQAHVYRVSASQDDTVFGGYTVVVLGN